MITVFTPTYNRENELPNLYNSLLTQKECDFEWLIVDDGSSDNTEQVVNNWINEKKININYIKKENGGKPSAYNEGLKHAKGDIFTCIDSDDVLLPNVLNVIEKEFNTLSEKSCGICYLCTKLNSDELIGTAFPEEVKEAYYYDIYHKLNVKGDKCMFMKTSIAKEYPFPLIEGEKFIPEALMFNRMAEKYYFNLINRPVTSKEYLEGGYSNNYFNLVKRNPKSNTLYFLEEYKFHPTFYNVYGYILFSIYSKKSLYEIIKVHPAKIKVALLFIPTLIISKIKR